MKKFSASEAKFRKRPSFYLMGTSLALLVAAFLSLDSSANLAPGAAAVLIKKGWNVTDRLDCSDVEAGKFYQVENDSTSVEVYVDGISRIVAARLPFPEAPYFCHEIPGPQFIEEIR